VGSTKVWGQGGERRELKKANPWLRHGHGRCTYSPASAAVPAAAVAAPTHERPPHHSRAAQWPDACNSQYLLNSRLRQTSFQSRRRMSQGKEFRCPTKIVLRDHHPMLHTRSKPGIKTRQPPLNLPPGLLQSDSDKHVHLYCAGRPVTTQMGVGLGAGAVCRRMLGGSSMLATSHVSCGSTQIAQSPVLNCACLSHTVMVGNHL